MVIKVNHKIWLNLHICHRIGDLSPLKYCLNLEELDMMDCIRLTDGSFKVFSEEPNSFPHLRTLNLRFFFKIIKLTEIVFEHLSKSNHLVRQLKELDVRGMLDIVSPTALNNICQLKGLRRLHGIPNSMSKSDKNKFKGELQRKLQNLEEVDWRRV